MTLQECAEELAKELENVKPEQIKILKVVDHKDCSNASKGRRLSEFINGFQYEISILYGVKRAFRDIVSKFSANGSMTPAILEFLTVNSVAELRDA